MMIEYKHNKLNSSESGAMLLETVFLSFVLLSLVSCMYFIQQDYENQLNCKARITAEYKLEYYLDEIAILHHSPENRNFTANGIEFFVKEECDGNVARVMISWNVRDVEHHVVQERRCR